MTLSTTDVTGPDDVESAAEGSAGTATGRRPGRREWGALVVAAAVLAGGLTWWLAGRDGLPDGAAFRLGDQVVTAQQVDRRVDALEALYGVKEPSGKGDRSEFLRDAAKSMAVQLMLQDEAEQRHLVIAGKEVDDTLGRLIEQRYPDGGRAAFVSALGQLGATEGQVRQEISDQLLVSRLYDDVAGDVSVGEAELKDTFDERRADLATPVRRELRNVVVADRSTADAVLDRLRSGESFAQVARTSSLDSATRDSGGQLGPVAADDLEKAYAEAAFGAKVGSTFGPVRTQHGWNVGRVERELPAEPATYAAVRDILRQTVLAEKSLAEWRAWLRKVIRAHEVTYADAYQPGDPDAVPDIGQAQLGGDQ